jgi:threonine/homoserine/homoserine lactone efflux protein
VPNLVNWTAVGAFLVAVTLGAMVPGSTTALVIRQSAVAGVRATVPLVVGVEVGLYTWVVASALGVAAVVAASTTAYTVLRVVGAAVLVVLGVQAWLASRRIREDTPVDVRPMASGRWWQAGTTGALTQLSNPKVAVFMVAFFPQFVPAGSEILLTTLLLGVLQVVVDGGWFLLVAVFVGRARRLLAKAAIRRGLERATGTVLIALGVRMALSRL